jgi:hypothetical protein
MNSFNSNKLLAFLLLVVMVLNPLVSAAGSLVFDKSSHGQTSSHHTVADIDATMETDNCHQSDDSRSVLNRADSGLSKQPAKDALDCCEDLCMCAEGGCHASLTMHFEANVSYSSNITIATFAVSGYNNPVLNSLTPPPIA